MSSSNDTTGSSTVQLSRDAMNRIASYARRFNKQTEQVAEEPDTHAVRHTADARRQLEHLVALNNLKMASCLMGGEIATSLGSPTGPVAPVQRSAIVRSYREAVRVMPESRIEINVDRLKARILFREQIENGDN